MSLSQFRLLSVWIQRLKSLLRAFNPLLENSGPGLNSAIHVIGSAAVLLVLLVPAEVIVTHTRHVRVVASRPSGVPCVPVTKPAHWRK